MSLSINESKYFYMLESLEIEQEWMKYTLKEDYNEICNEGIIDNIKDRIIKIKDRIIKIFKYIVEKLSTFIKHIKDLYNNIFKKNKEFKEKCEEIKKDIKKYKEPEDPKQIEKRDPISYTSADINKLKNIMDCIDSSFSKRSDIIKNIFDSASKFILRSAYADISDKEVDEMKDIADNVHEFLDEIDTKYPSIKDSITNTFNIKGEFDYKDMSKIFSVDSEISYKREFEGALKKEEDTYNIVFNRIEQTESKIEDLTKHLNPDIMDKLCQQINMNAMRYIQQIDREYRNASMERYARGERMSKGFTPTTIYKFYTIIEKLSMDIIKIIHISISEIGDIAAIYAYIQLEMMRIENSLSHKIFKVNTNIEEDED